MKSTKLTLQLTDKQLKKIKEFLLSHKIKCDNKKQFGLIAEPKIDYKKIIVKLLTVKQAEKIDKFLQKNRIYND